MNYKSSLLGVILSTFVFASASCGGASTSYGGSGRATSVSIPQNNENSPLGTNLSEVREYSTEMAFVDVMKHSRTWTSQQVGQPWGKGGVLAQDSNGWITSLAAGQSADLLMQWGLPGDVAETGYVLLYDGDGTIELRGTAKQKSATPGRIVFDVEPNGTSGIVVSLKATNPFNYVRNIRVIRPGFELTYATEPFHPVFLSKIAPFKVLRFMDWQKTNNNTLANWADRNTPATYTQTRDSLGVALEYQIALANKLNADAWFNIPVNATDDFVLQFATMVKAKLNPKLKVYIEYSNEAWNGIFNQTFILQDIGQGKKPPISKSPGPTPLGNNAFESGLKYYSFRSVEIFDIFSKVFAGDTARLVRVMGGQAANAFNGATILAFNNAYLKTDAYAIAPYFAGDLGNRTKAELLTYSTNAVLDYCENYIATTLRTRIREHIAILAPYGIPLIAYEGGQHLVGVGALTNDQAITDLFVAANRHPRMKDIYKTYLDVWKGEGGGMFVNFTSIYVYGKFGSWGLFEYQNQDIATAYKYQAEMEWIVNNPLFDKR